jgi:FlaA1/EpsC-like NDP-sugar epimerase
LRVFKPKHIQQMIDETGAQEILLAIPSASRARRREILGLLEPYPLHVRSVPGFIDLANGRCGSTISRRWILLTCWP